LAFTTFYAAPLLLFEQLLGSDENASTFIARPWWQQAPAWSYVAVMLVVFQAARSGQFIYFQF